MTEQKQDRMEMVYNAGGQEVKLSPSIVQQFIIKGQASITQEEAVNFMQLCKYSELNPFLNEAYLIKYGSSPAQMVVSKEAIMKRANRQPDYNGFKAGVIIEKDGELVYRTGQFATKQETLLGGWAKVYRKGIDMPFEIEVSLSEYNTGKSMWAKMPANMIRKVALVNALREAYPEALGAMYSEDEPTPAELKEAAKNEPKNDETTAQLLDGFKQEIKAAGVLEEDNNGHDNVETEHIYGADFNADYNAKVIDAEIIEDKATKEEVNEFEQGGLFKGRTLTPDER